MTEAEAKMIGELAVYNEIVDTNAMLDGELEKAKTAKGMRDAEIANGRMGVPLESGKKKGEFIPMTEDADKNRPVFSDVEAKDWTHLKNPTEPEKTDGMLNWAKTQIYDAAGVAVPSVLDARVMTPEEVEKRLFPGRYGPEHQDLKREYEVEAFRGMTKFLLQESAALTEGEAAVVSWDALIAETDAQLTEARARVVRLRRARTMFEEMRDAGEKFIQGRASK